MNILFYGASNTWGFQGDQNTAAIPAEHRKNALTRCISGAILQVGKSNKYATWKHEAKPLAGATARGFFCFCGAVNRG